ncbi:nucleotidyl cyclase domain-containing protein [Streptomyces coelicoflavus]|uniref:hypothetical protein n=1 Tax=Streptomyces coelicoflavus TaxID=285562 RepID=UPI0036336EB5
MGEEATHHWIVVLDVENFSSRRDPVQRRVRAAMYRALAEALRRAGITDADTVSEDRGDGVLMLVAPSVSPRVLAGPFVRELDEALGEYAQEANADHALRLRVALHQGLAARDAHGWSGDAVNTACRLVDAQPLRDVLAEALSARLVLAVSDEVHRGVVRHGHRGIDPAAYLRCDFTTKHGETITSWITVPGYPAPPGLPAPGDPAATAPPAPGATSTGPGATSAVPAGNDTGPDAAGRPSVALHAQTVQGDQVAGDKHVTVHNTGSVRP